MRIVNIMLSSSAIPFGTERVAYKYTDLFLKQGHEILFVYKNNYDLDFIDAKNKKLSLCQIPRKNLWALLKLRFFLWRWKPDVIFVHNFFSRMRFVGFGIAPMIGIAHLGKFRPMKSYEGAVAFRKDLAEKAFQEGVSKEKIFSIQNTCNIKKNPKVKAFRKIPLIGALGRFSGEKNFDTFLKALGILKRRKVKFKCILHGAGGDEEKLKSIAKKEGLLRDISFPGFTNDIEKFYDTIDIFCIPSRIEFFSLAILEAMHMQKPIVASDIENFKEVLPSQKFGLCSKVESPESFAKNLKFLIQNPQKAVEMGKNARKRYDTHYAEDVIYEKLMKMIKKVKK